MDTIWGEAERAVIIRPVDKNLGKCEKTPVPISAFMAELQDPPRSLHSRANSHHFPFPPRFHFPVVW